MTKKNKKLNSNSNFLKETIKIGDLLSKNYQVEKEQPIEKKISFKKKLERGEAEIWLSKKGRAGKIASLVILKGVSQKEQELLFKELKKKLACGGNIKDKEWLVQTSKRELIKNFLENHQIKSKFCGG